MKKNNKYPMFKQLKNLLVVVLSVSMMISMLYQPTYAMETGNEGNNTVNTTAEDYEKDHVNVFDYESSVFFSEEDIDYEDESLREEYVKHFVMNDGTTQAVVYETQVHELDDNGTYQEIDNTLSDNDTELENTKNDKWKVKFSKKSKDTLVHIHEDNMNIKWGIVDYKDTEATYLVDDEPYTKLSNKAVSAVVVYEDILDHIDIQYQLSHKQVKENVILKNKEAQHTIYYALDTNGYDITVVDNTIVLSKDNKEDYVITAPYMMDSNGVFHDGITLTLENNLVKMELDEEWLLSEDRAYPVTVDPTIKKQLTNSSVDNTSVNSVNPNSSAMYQYGAMYVGREASSYGKVRGAFKFTLPTIDSSNMVIRATITLSQLNYYGGGNVYVRCAPISKSLALSTLTWNKLRGNLNNATDFVNVRASTVGKKFSFDVTRAVREWYTKKNNYGLALLSSNESGDYKYATFVTTRNSGMSSRWPYATVTYLSQDGMESHLTYQTMNTRTMGTFNVGDFNGNLIYTYNDFSMSGNHMPVGVSHVYNHHQRDEVNTVSSNMKLGKGMRLNVNMQIKYNSEDKYYTLTDEDGTIHYFNKNTDTGKYHKEYDSEVTITVNENNYELNNHTQRIYFHKTTGFIDKVEDIVTGKVQTYTYNTNNQLISITDGANRNTEFSYDENTKYLTSIEYADERLITYTYENDQLKTITQADGTVISFTYNGDLLESVANAHEGKITVTYLSQKPRRVETVKRYGKDMETEGDSLTFTYHTGETEVTDEDGYALTYMFDLSGHTICVKDSEGNAVYGQYTNTENDNKHSLNFESKLQTSTINLAKNHNPVNTNDWILNSTAVSVIDTTNETQAEFTGKAFQLLNTTNITQDINYDIAQNESYTLSAYVKVKSATPIDTTQEYGVYVGINDGTLHRSDTYTDLNEWRRISYTYTASTDITKNNWKIDIGTLNTSGEVLVKNIQLEKGTVANRYNFVENGHFYDTEGTLDIDYWDRGTYLTDSDKIVTTGYDGNGYYVTGKLGYIKSITQVLDIKGNEGDVFVVSGWLKGSPMPKNNLQESVEGNSAIRRECIALMFLNEDGSSGEVQEVYFESMSQNWQYVSGSIKAPQNYNGVKVILRHGHQVRPATFDNIQLYMESFGYSYEHDDKGRIIVEQDVEGNIVKTYYKDITITEADGEEKTEDVVDYVEYKRKNDTEYLKKTVYEYNTRGKVSKETYTDFNVPENDESRTVETIYEYDSNYNLVSTTINGQTKYESGKINYSTNYITSYTDERGKVTNYQFDQANGNIEKVTDDNLTETIYTYKDKTSKIESVTTDNSKVEYEYEESGLVKEIKHNTTDSTTDVVYTFSYDKFGNVESIKVGNRTLATYAYGEKNGTLNTTTYKINDTKNEVLSYTYDTLERVTGIKENNVLKYSWEYGNDGKIGRFIDYNEDQTIRYSYDLSGNLIEEERSDGTYLFNTYKKDSSLLLTTGYEKGNNKSTTSVTYNPREEVETVTWNTNASLSSISYTRDFLRRIRTSTYQVNNVNKLTTAYNYIELTKDTADEGDDVTTNVLEDVQNTYDNTTDTYSYGFDDLGNITSLCKKSKNLNTNVENEIYTNTYEYDKLNQLIRENNQELGKTYTFSYDFGGNIKEVKTYGYTVNQTINTTLESTEEYTYGNSDWKDLLTGYKVTENNEVIVNGTIEYDNIGNPTKYYDNKQFTWSFRRLEQIVDGSNTYSYTYNQDGIRTSKTVNGVTTNYIVSGNKILQETNDSYTIIYEYDALGNASSFVYNDGNTTSRYIYVRNGTNDIVGILNSSGSLVASYTYDGWGNCTINGTNTTIGNINPLRYRGYYYDQETGYYYLNSRYYDSNVGRFISSDEVTNLGVNEDYNSLNLYTYCSNNPINRIDESGDFYSIISSAVFNLCTSFIMAKVTNQPYTVTDGLMALICGAVSSFENYGRYFSGVLSFAYTFEKTYDNTSNLYVSLITGLISGSVAALNLKKYIGLEKGWEVEEKIVNFIFGGGIIVMEAGINAGLNNRFMKKKNSNAVNSNMQKYTNSRKIVMKNIFQKKFAARYGLC